MIVACDQCGKETSKDRSRVERNKHNFCSKACSSLFRTKHLDVPSIVTCGVCGIALNRSPAKTRPEGRNFCSKKCQYAAADIGAEERRVRHNARRRNWIARNKGKNSEYGKKWRENSPEKASEVQRNWASKNKAIRADQYKKKIRNLDDYYIRNVLKCRKNITSKDIPQSLVEIKRVELKLKRTIKELQNV